MFLKVIFVSTFTAAVEHLFFPLHCRFLPRWSPRLSVVSFEADMHLGLQSFGLSRARVAFCFMNSSEFHPIMGETLL